MSLVTVGHGTLPQRKFAALLAGAGVARLIDVRTYPASRRNPHFRREAMADWLPASGVAYRWEPRLGGRRRPVEVSPHVALREEGFRGYAQHMQSEEFQAALDELLAEASAATTVIMCAESVWWRCHRRLISDAALLLHDVAVLHLFHNGRLAPHVPTEAARVQRPLEPGRPQRIIYDVSANLPLPPAR
ncbi:MAG: DUF488 domain-containing protein [Actinomycetota bacterium]|nr:DUF488 domain-containing protein [Actinomycetota bacterium]